MLRKRYTIGKGFTQALLAVGTVFLAACARIGSAPTGGPPDLAPPVLLKALPQEGCTEFSQQDITLDFDEYIVLQNTDKIVTSPAISKISYRANLKRLYIKIEDTLLENRTYSIDFKDAIGDLHESTPLRNYTYYFSTGKRIDSGRLAGRVLDAFGLTPVKEASVMFYAEKPQEYPVITPPDYMAVTDTAGMFNLQYVRDGCYYVLAGSDENRNYLIEPTEEKTAFASGCWQTVPLKPAIYFDKQRGVKESDTASFEAYTALLQARKEEELAEIKAADRILYLYQDKDEKSLLKEAKWNRKGEIELSWYYEPDSSLRFSFLPSFQDYELAKMLMNADTAVEEHKGRGRRRQAEKEEMPNLLWQDSLLFYYIPQDNPLSGKICFNNYNVSDLRLLVDHLEFSDTAELMLNAGAAAQKDTAAFRVSSRQKSLFFKDSLLLDFSFPLSCFDLQHASLTRYHVDIEGRRDTFQIPIGEVSVRQIRPDRLQLNYAWQPGNTYRLVLPASCFSDYFFRDADTTVLNLTCPDLETYGQVAVSIRNLQPGDYELQMVDAKKNVILSLPVPESGNVEFEYVQPAYVSFVLVRDENRNHIWDAGDYRQGIQPERRWFFPKTVRVEADWRVEETWTLED
ncbi:MAG: Ig-like domain-containing protein [Bacteroides sp.]|nr:Ig-like domain-containing protein [Bacteroides sp.]MCM1084795.1 Ig-like domain-containing protein [Bacteroides sp.]